MAEMAGSLVNACAIVLAVSVFAVAQYHVSIFDRLVMIEWEMPVRLAYVSAINVFLLLVMVSPQVEVSGSSSMASALRYAVMVIWLASSLMIMVPVGLVVYLVFGYVWLNVL